jgi:FtsH-binding integral membrane protein
MMETPNTFPTGGPENWKKTVRHGFIRKVYGIVGTQLLLTTEIAGAIMAAGGDYLRQNASLTFGLILASSVFTIGTMCIFCCCPQLMLRSPQNYIILFVFTIAESIVVGLVCVQYKTDSVIMAFGILCVVVFGLTVFACQTRYDFTGCGPYLVVALLVLMAFGFFMWIASFFAGSQAMETANVVYACFGALIFSFYIVYDTQLLSIESTSSA